jgi:hypothetical protein
MAEHGVFEHIGKITGVVGVLIAQHDIFIL